MTRRTIATLLFAVVLAASAAGPVAVASGAERPRARKVVLILAPYLRWEDVVSGQMPETRRLAEAGATANMNVRSLLPRSGHAGPEAGALMLSAGTWARFDASATAPAQTATGVPAIEFPGLEAQRRRNADANADVRPGALGQAIVRAGGVTAAIGNGDGRLPSRPAALAAMDERGKVAFGDVSTATVIFNGDEDAPLGRISDASAILAVMRRVLADAGDRPALVVIDPGDLSRAHVAADHAPDEAARVDRLAALAAFDAVVEGVEANAPGDAVVIVAAPVAAQPRGTPSGFGPLVVHGGGWEGTLLSASTHRAGLVTQADLTATILDILGIRIPPVVAGAPLTVRATRPVGDERIRSLASDDAFMRSVDGVRPRVLDTFITLFTVIVAIAVLLVVSGAPAALARGIQLSMLALLSVPVASVLMYAVIPRPQTPGIVAAALLATAAVVWVVGVTPDRASGHPRALATLALLTVGVVLVDQWMTGPLSVNGLLSYSPLVGARYYGLGNEGAALVVGSALTGWALLLDTFRETDWTRAARRYGFPLLGAACVLTAAAPMLGANIGVAVWGTFAFGLAWWGMMGRRIGWRAILVVMLCIVVLIAALAGIDLLTSGPRTHLGRSITAALEGGPMVLWTIVARKAATNVRVSLMTRWTRLFAVLVVVLAYVRIRPPGVLRDLLSERPTFASTLTASLVAAVVSYFTEDSGIVVPALLLLFPVVAVVYLMLGSSHTRRRGA